ncbi:MAG: hypothetical protein QOC82_2186 [Frankiaceae bacterium]|jgi:hypothetical protein|nr:hypothetical protein [Frankiaceae bacterium]
MKFSAKVRLGLVAVVAAASAVTMVPANAATGDAAVIAGSGTISPGLTLAGGAQTFTFSGTGAGTVAGMNGQATCDVTGDDTIGTYSQGAGSFHGSCNTPCGTVGVAGTYTRTGSVVSGGGAATSGCGSITVGYSLSLHCVFNPTSGPTVTSYALVCTLN